MKKHLKYFGVGLIFAALITVVAIVIIVIIDYFDKHPRNFDRSMLCLKISAGILLVYLLGKHIWHRCYKEKKPDQQNTAKSEDIKYDIKKVNYRLCAYDPHTTELKCNKCGRVDVEWYNTQPGDMCGNPMELPCEGFLVRVKKSADANPNNYNTG